MQNSAQATQQSGGFDVEPSETSCRGLALVTWIRRRRGSGGALVRFCSQKPGRRFSPAPAAFPPTDSRLPVAHIMVNVRRAPELLLPTIEGVMVRAGLAPPPPTICPARAPVERSTRWKRYHPYARATLPTRDMDDEYDVFAFSASRRWSEATVVPTVHWDDVEEDVEGSDVAAASRLLDAIEPIVTPAKRPILRRRLSRMVIDLANAVLRRIHTGRSSSSRSASGSVSGSSVSTTA